MEEYEQTPLAILGVGCYVPGACSTDKYWSLLMNGRYAISKLPHELLDRELYFDPKRGVPGKTYCEYAGIVQRFAADPAYHPCPTRLKEFLDVAPVMMCRAAADACREAGRDPFRFRGPRTGVYVGSNTIGPRAEDRRYALIAGKAGECLARLPAWKQLAGPQARSIAEETVQAVRAGFAHEELHPARLTSFHMVANAVSEAYGLGGPSMVLDAVCSSSLKAMAVAQRDITQGVTDMAFVGGAYVYGLDPLLQFALSQAASGNISCPFSDQVDGVITSEGFLVVLVKALDRAIADGDPIRCVVRRIGISSDGRGKSAWAPRKEGQIEAMRRAYPDESEMARLVYLEAHATSTPIGDATELESLTEVFQGKLPAKIPVGSAKANIGHALEASGLASLIKSMLVLQHNLAPRQIHCDTLNSRVDWEALPFFVPLQHTPLRQSIDGRPRLAAINAIGVGGVNAHAVIEEPPRADQPPSAVSVRTRGWPTRLEAGTVGGSMTTLQSEPIAIVGCGALYPGATTIDAFEQLIYSPKDVRRQAPEDRWYHHDAFPISGAVDRNADTPVPVAGFVHGFEYDWRRGRISPKQVARADPLLFMILDSVHGALADAGYDTKPYDQKRTEIIVGSNADTDFAPEVLMGGRIPHFIRQWKSICKRRGILDSKQIESVAEAFAKEVLDEMPGMLDELTSSVPSGMATQVAKALDVMGGAGAIDSGDTSGLAALAGGVASLRAGASDMVVCIAGSNAIGLQLHAARSLADAGGAAPPAQGAGTLILKRLSDARRDGDPIRAIIHAVGAGFSASAEEAFTLAIRRAWEARAVADNPCLDPAMVQAIELSSAEDSARSAERKALAAYYRSPGRNEPILLGTIDGLLGDAMAAATVASVIKAGVQLEKLTLPGFADICRPVSASDGDDGDILHAPLNDLPLRRPEPGRPALAAVSGYDSFGSAYHVILERGTRVPVGDQVPNMPFPLLSKFWAEADGELVGEVVFDPCRDTFLHDHLLRNQPLLPGVAAIEAFAETAVRTGSHSQVVALHDLRFVEGLRFLDDNPKTGKVFACPDGHLVNCRLAVDFRNRRGDLLKANRIYTTGVVELSDHCPRLDIPCPPGCPERGWYDIYYLEPESTMYHGPVFQELRRVAHDDPEFWGELVASPPSAFSEIRGGEGWRTRPATVDACLYLSGFGLWRRTGGSIGLPLSMDHLRLGREPRPGEECLVYTRLVEADDQSMYFDFTLVGDDGEALLHGERFCLQLMPTSKRFATAKKHEPYSAPKTAETAGSLVPDGRRTTYSSREAVVREEHEP